MGWMIFILRKHCAETLVVEVWSRQSRGRRRRLEDRSRWSGSAVGSALHGSRLASQDRLPAPHLGAADGVRHEVCTITAVQVVCADQVVPCHILRGRAR